MMAGTGGLQLPGWMHWLDATRELDCCAGVGSGGHRKISIAVLEHIRAEYPFWDRRQGADHVWLFAHDHG